MRKHRIFALLLCLCLALSLVPFGAFAADGEIHITTASQLRDLAGKCRLDSWSVGKTVVLDCDIDMGGVEFEPIPSFGGTFDGGGHSISGLYVKGDGSAVGGLFRFVQSGGLVKNLNVEGRIAPEMNAESFGGIAGENSGCIKECTFSGSVSGSVETGGIVGVNTSDGVIEDCRSLASVSGEHYTGGIAGRNLGSIIRCTNLGPVNTTNPEIEGEALDMDIDWEHLNSAENVAAHTDTGGISGFSQGTLDQCVNRGNIGYPHVGYNVGGVAGRQSGFVNACRNFGIVNGRKDVGGVIGQMVPDIEMHFSGSAMEQLRTDMTELQTLLDDLIADVQGSSNEISGILTQAGAYLDSAGHSAGVIVDSLTGFVDGNLDTINGFIAIVESYGLRVAAILGNIEECFDHLSKALEAIDAFLDTPGNADKYPELFEKLSYAAEKMGEAGEMLTGALGVCRSLMGELEEYFAELQQNPPGAGEMDEALDEFLTVMSAAAGKASTALDLLMDAADSMGDAMDNGLVPAMEILSELTEIGDISGTLKIVTDELNAAIKSMGYAVSGLESLIRDLGNEDMGAFEGLGEDFMEETDRMEAALLGLSGEMEKLNNAVNGSVNTLGGDLRAVNEQFFKVMNGFMDMLESGSEAGEIYEDMSEEELFTATDGKVQKSENRGAVAGDLNTGGLVGTIGIEYDLDPEEDISVSGSTGGTFRYFTNAVLLEGVNYESVTGKKNCVGGAVGYMDLGVIYGCENYGNLASSSGDYVGGMAGQSAAAIRNCWSLCALSGRDYVGGIAGSVDDVSGCRSIVEISASGGWKGAIAGEVSGEAKDNFFVGEALGGIDGVSYAGKAEPQSYAEFTAAENVPGEFKNFKLTFATDSVQVKSINFSYGKSIDMKEIPPVPERVGYVGEWEQYDYTNLTFSDTIYAVYTPYDTVVAVEDKLGKRSLLLLEGSFLPGTVPVIEPAEAPKGSCEAWSVSCRGLVEESYTLRYLKPDISGDVDIRVLRDGRWQSVECREEGSYLLFEGKGESLTFAAAEREKNIPLWPFLLTAGGGLALVAIVLIMRAQVGRRKKKTII